MTHSGKITTGFSMSLDGFIAGPNEDFQQLFAWMGGGDTEYALKISEESVRRFDKAIQTTGALEETRVSHQAGVTHLTHRVKKG